MLALGAVLATSGEPRLAQRGLVLSVAGMAFIMALFGAATFAQPAIGRAYLAGQQAAVAVNSDLYGAPAVVVGVTGGLLYSAGAVLLGIAIWRAGTLPRWAGPLYAVAVPLIAVVGLAVGVAQPVGAMLLIISGARIASTVWARPVGPRAVSQAHGSPPSSDPAGKTTDLDLKFVNQPGSTSIYSVEVAADRLAWEGRLAVPPKHLHGSMSPHIPVLRPGMRS